MEQSQNLQMFCSSLTGSAPKILIAFFMAGTALNVDQLFQWTGLSRPTIYQGLKVLKEFGILKSKKIGHGIEIWNLNIERSRAGLINHEKMGGLRKSRKRAGVYVLKCRELYKIGRSNDLQFRMKAFRTANPFDIEVIRLFETEKSLNLEKDLHKTFQHRRVNGEWFNLDSGDISRIKNMSVDGVK
jgi:Predicted transcriptional regulators